LVAVHRADEAVDIDDQALRARSRASGPGTAERLPEHAVELAHVPEGKRAQERADRRGRGQPAAKQPARAPRAEQLAVVDRVGAEQHRVDERDQLAAGVGPARAVATQAHAAPDERLDPEPRGERCHERDPGVCDDPLVVEAVA
jgi:hypothetical protein